jgi:dephospho-CoA kinase
MKVFGLTGGIGTGKTTAAAMLKRRGIAVADTDEIAREVVEPRQPALEEIRRQFGDEVIGTDGRLRREEMARRVFADEAARRQLEAIVHPRIRECWLAQVAAWRAEKRGVGVVVIPLLFETDATRHFDFTVCLACSAATQRARLTGRGWPAGQIEQRITAQWPLEKKMASSDFVVWTEGTLEVLEQQLARVIA